MKTKSKKLGMIMLFVVVVAAKAMVLSACSQQQKSDAVRKYGESKAFIKVYYCDSPHPNEERYQMNDYGEFDKYNLHTGSKAEGAGSNSRTF